jgi:uncharacterized membrane protein
MCRGAIWGRLIVGSNEKHLGDEKERKVKHRGNRTEKPQKTAYYAGAGVAIGAVVGMMFGLLLFENLAMGSAIGAGVGLVVGAMVDTQRGDDTDRRE